MSVNLVYMLSGDLVIADVKEITVQDRLIGYQLDNPHRADIMDPSMMGGPGGPGGPGGGPGAAGGEDDADSLKDLYGKDMLKGHQKDPRVGDPSRFLSEKPPLIKDNKEQVTIDINLVPWQPLAKLPTFTLPADKIVCVFEPVRDLLRAYNEKIEAEMGAVNGGTNIKKSNPKSVKQILDELDNKVKE